MAYAYPENSRLCYLSPDHVEGPLPGGRLDVRDRNDRRIGNFAGIIFDPEARCVRYLVVDASGLFRHKRYLVPIDPTQIDREHHSLRVGRDSTELNDCMNFDPGAFPDFSDDDLIEALFPGRPRADEVH